MILDCSLLIQNTIIMAKKNQDDWNATEVILTAKGIGERTFSAEHARRTMARNDNNRENGWKHTTKSKSILDEYETFLAGTSAVESGDAK